MEMQTELKENILVARVTGKVELTSLLQLFLRVTDLAAEKRIHKILIDALEITGTLSTLEHYELATKVAAHALQLRTNPRVAFVGVPPTADDYGVLVAQNRGLVVELFSHIPEAMGWLRRWPNPEGGTIDVPVDRRTFLPHSCS